MPFNVIFKIIFYLQIKVTIFFRIKAKIDKILLKIKEKKFPISKIDFNDINSLKIIYFDFKNPFL